MKPRISTGKRDAAIGQPTGHPSAGLTRVWLRTWAPLAERRGRHDRVRRPFLLLDTGASGPPEDLVPHEPKERGTATRASRRYHDVVARIQVGS